jgi:uncharacterized protein (DUF885 family)
LPDYLGVLLKAVLDVKRVEAFRETAGWAAHYRRGTKGASRPGTFYVYLADMEAVAVNRLENFSYHEGVLVHYMQRSVQTELENIPQFRSSGSYTADGEGWACMQSCLAKKWGVTKILLPIWVDCRASFGVLSGYSSTRVYTPKTGFKKKPLTML